MSGYRSKSLRKGRGLDQTARLSLGRSPGPEQCLGGSPCPNLSPWLYPTPG